jgi:iron complex outermembrane recepter protein
MKRTYILGTVSGLALVVALAAVAPAAFAQAAANEKGTAELETVTVTGYRMKEDIQKVSASISALSADQLVVKSVLQVSDLQYATPALSITDAGLSQNVNIRGVGMASGSPYASPGVPVYLDGLVQAPVVFSNGFFDIQDVEVYRGPQGTFAGANSTGGAVFINSHNPTLGKFDGSIEAWGGDYWDVGVRGAVNVPLDDTMAFRVAFNTERRDSFFKSVNSAGTPTGVQFNTPGALDEKDIRLGFYWEPISNLSVLLKLNGSEKSTDGYAAVPSPGTDNAAYAPKSLRELDYDTPEMNKERADRAMLEVKYVLPSGITLRSVTGYQDNLVKNVYDMDATSETSVYVWEKQDTAEKPFSQEINILSPEGGKLSWVLGAFYYYDVVKVGLDLGGTTLGSFEVYGTMLSDKQSEAVFGNVKYQVTDALQLELGARFTQDETWGAGAIYIGVPGGLTLSTTDQTAHYTGNNWTGKIGANYQLDNDNFLYAFVSKGAKAGGAGPSYSFKGETVWDYEAGWKSSWLENRLMTQLASFYSQYKNYQVDASVLPATGQSATINTPEATIYGIEVQANGMIGGFHFDVAGAWVQSSIGAATLVAASLLPSSGSNGTLGPQCATGVASNPPTCFDYTSYIRSVSGKRNMYSPTWTANFGVEYPFTINSKTTLTPRVDYTFQGSQWTTLLETSSDYMASHDLWNLHLTLDHDTWSLSAYLTNLFDKEYVTGKFSTTQYMGPPRQYGARLTYRF